jgi:uncharacterized protein YqeY
MLRRQLEDALKHAMKAREPCRVATIRLILAALKDREIAERGKGNGELDDRAILAMLQTMIRQRRESIELYERGGRVDLAQREAEEIAVIHTFMPPAIEGEDLVSAVRGVVDELNARTIKDMGRTMACLKSKYSGRMDFAKASGLVRELLAPS